MILYNPGQQRFTGRRGHDRRRQRAQRPGALPALPAPRLQAQSVPQELLVRVPVPRLALRPARDQGGRRRVRPGSARHGPLLDHRRRVRRPDHQHRQDHARAAARGARPARPDPAAHADRAASDADPTAPTSEETDDRHARRTGARAAPARPAAAGRAGARSSASPRRRRRAHVELSPERAAQVVRQSSNARWVGFLAVIVVILFITIYWFYELAPLGIREPRLDAEASGPAGHLGRARLQPVRGQLRALPRRERRGRDRTGAQPPGQAVRPPVGRLPQQHDDRRRPLRLRQRRTRSCRSGRTRDDRPGPLNYIQIEDLIAFIRAPSSETYTIRDPSLFEPKRDPITNEVKTFNGWVDVELQAGPRRDAVPGLLVGRVQHASGVGRRRPAPRRPRPVRPARPAASAGPERQTVSLVAQASPGTTPDLTAPADASFVIALRQPGRGDHRTTCEIKDSAGAVVFTGDTFPGVATRDFTVPALDAGTYPFVCTVHPTMTGTLTVK